MNHRMLMAEGLGTALLLIGVVGSGIMAESLSGGNVGLALLANAVATGAMLFAIITVLGPVSGAHFNPAVTLAFFLRGQIRLPLAMGFVAVQMIGGVFGVWIAHAMFDLSIWQTSSTVRSGTNLWISEVVATFGLLFVIFGGLRQGANVALLVAVYITGAYWFTSSTSFANPAVTIARSLSDTFAGIAPENAPAFIAAQILAVLIAHHALRWLLEERNPEKST